MKFYCIKPEISAKSFLWNLIVQSYDVTLIGCNSVRVLMIVVICLRGVRKYEGKIKGLVSALQEQ